MTALPNFVLCLLSPVIILNVCATLQNKEIIDRITKSMQIEASEILETSTDFTQSPSEEIQVNVKESNDFSITMTVTAALVLRRALKVVPDYPCGFIRDYFLEKYDGYEWHCVVYKTFAVRAKKFIGLEVEDTKYLLFATNK